MIVIGALEVAVAEGMGIELVDLLYAACLLAMRRRVECVES